jgi:hypothetical protein
MRYPTAEPSNDCAADPRASGLSVFSVYLPTGTPVTRLEFIYQLCLFVIWDHWDVVEQTKEADLIASMIPIKYRWSSQTDSKSSSSRLGELCTLKPKKKRIQEQ